MKELTDITNIIESTPDNTELGKKIREYYKQSHENENGFIVCHRCHAYQSPLNHLCKYCKHPLHGDNDHE